jgi:hypothetical protein
VGRGTITEQDDAALFSEVLSEAIATVERAEIAYAVFGSIASFAYGRPDASGDIDLLLRPHEADRALDALAEAGFAVERTDPAWIYKAWRDGVLVDLIFRTKGDIPLDDDVLAHATLMEYSGRVIRVVSPEDALVIEAAGNQSQEPQRWENALAILAQCTIDWDYLERRARFAARRTLSLLIYAQSNDLIVPERTIRSLFDSVYAR